MRPLIVFDLDGTLIDSRLDLANSTNEMLASFGASPLPIDEVAAMVGEGAKVLVQRALGAAGLDADETAAFSRFLAIYDRRLLEHTRLYPGVKEAVSQAAAHATLAVLTNKPAAPTTTILNAVGLTDCFRWIIGGDQQFPRKPDPASLRHLMTEAQVTPEMTLYVGDSMIDVETARRAGVRICVVLYGFGVTRGNLELSPDDLQAADAAALRAVLAEWLRQC